MAKKPPPLSQAGGGWRGKGGTPAHHHHHHHPQQHHKHPHHHHHKGGGGPMTPGGGPPLSKAGGGWRGKSPPHHPKARHHHHAKKHPKRTLAGTPLGDAWILGGNDAAGNCALVAVANGLLAATGERVSDGELLRIHDRAGPLSIPEALQALGLKFPELQPGGTVPWPVVAGLVTPHGPHAALLLGGDLVTWGGLLALPDDWDIDEMWAVTW